MRRSAWTALLLAAVVNVSCGGTGGAADRISIAIAPATATVATGATLALTASGNLPKYTNVVWTVENSGLPCTTNVLPPSSSLEANCPSGWLFVPQPTGNVAQTSATYHAPNTPGVFQVHAHAELTVPILNFVPSTADATAKVAVKSQ